MRTLLGISLALLASASHAADLQWVKPTQLISYQIEKSQYVGTPDEVTSVRLLTIQPALNNEIRIKGDDYPVGGILLPFGPDSLVLPRFPNTFIPGDLTWFSLPRNALNVSTGTSYTTVVPDNPVAPGTIVMRNTSLHEITGVSATTIAFRAEYRQQLENNVGFERLVRFLTAPPNSEADTAQSLSLLTTEWVSAVCDGSFDIATASIEKMACVWQPLPGSPGWDTTDLLNSPNRIIVNITKF